MDNKIQINEDIEKSWKPLMDTLEKELPDYTFKLLHLECELSSFQPYGIVDVNGKQWACYWNPELILPKEVAWSPSWFHGIYLKDDVLKCYVDEAKKFIKENGI
jgi:hypothetical protein